MNCSEIRSRISELIDEELSYSESQKFQQHIEGCAACSNIHTGLQQIKSDLALQPVPSLSADFVGRLQEAIRLDAARGPTLWQQLTTPKVAGLTPLSASGLLAAAVSAIIVGSSLFRVETAPIVTAPTATASQIGGHGPQAVPAYNIPGQPTMPALAAQTDSTVQRRDSSRRDFSKQLQLVNQKRP